MIKQLFAAACLMAVSYGSFAAGETYVVGSGGTYRPFEYENSQQQLEGFDIDLIKAIAKSEDFNIKLVNTPGKAFLPRWVAAIATSLFQVLPLLINVK